MQIYKEYLTKNNKFMTMFKYKEFRRAHSMFQSHLAEVMGINQSNVSRYETEGIPPTPEQYKRLCEKFGKEEVDAFMVDNTNVVATHNVNGSGVQNNGIQSDKDMLAIVKNLTETLSEHVKKQDIMAEQMMALLQKLALK